MNADRIPPRQTPPAHLRVIGTPQDDKEITGSWNAGVEAPPSATPDLHASHAGYRAVVKNENPSLRVGPIYQNRTSAVATTKSEVVRGALERMNAMRDAFQEMIASDPASFKHFGSGPTPTPEDSGPQGTSSVG